MRRLPRLAYGSTIWELPLADCSARALEEALLASTGSACRERLVALLSEDPALTLWAVCQANVLDGRELRTCQAAADWLDTHLLTRLDWSASGVSSAAEIDVSVAGRYAKLAAAGVVTGMLAKRCAELEPDGCPDEALTAGLLTGARDWLGESAASAAAPEAVAACLPAWLAALLAGCEESGLRGSGPLACAARAAAMLAGAEVDDERAGAMRETCSSEALDAVERATARRWRARGSTVHQRLPALVAKLRRLAELQQQFQTELEAAKLEAMKELAYGAGHEINNPLANISARAQTLLKEEHDPERRRKLAAINSQAFRAHEMIADMMLFARPPRLQPKALDVVGIIDAVVAELAAEANARGTAIEHRRPPGAVMVMADEVQLAVALRALCVNALEALGTGGQVRLEAKVISDGGAAPRPQVVVTDTGPGIRPEIRRHLFDPFFSGREAGRGLGFGLSKCWRIVTDHGGQIVVDTPAGGGAVFTVQLLAPEQTGPSPPGQLR